MKLAAFEAVVQTLERAGVRYLVAGGFAVNAHGYIRLTMDIDLVIVLDAENIHKTFDALAKLGYQPTVPVTADAFANAEQRQRWREEKGMQVLNFHSTEFPATSVDIFVYEPFDFRQEYTDALRGELMPGVVARFVSIETLIAMKKAAARPRDLDDIQHLLKLQDGEKDG